MSLVAPWKDVTLIPHEGQPFTVRAPLPFADTISYQGRVFVRHHLAWEFREATVFEAEPAPSVNDVLAAFHRSCIGLDIAPHL